MMKYPSIFVVDSNKNSSDILKIYFQEFGFEGEIKTFENYTDALNEIKTSQDLPIVFADISNLTAKQEEILNSIKLYTNKIVFTSIDYSTNLIIKAMRMGAKEFLTKPIIKDDLERTLKMLLNLDSKLEESGNKIITVFSNKGGIGKTTIAVNLALELAKSTRDKVALLDLNLQLGDVSTFLNLTPSFDLNYVIKNLTDIKQENLLTLFENYKDTGLYVLSDPNFIEQAETIKPEEISGLLKTLKQIFPYIIIDMSANLDSNSLKILDISDWIMFTTIVNIPAIRNCQRCLNLFESRNYPDEKIKIILNRFMENEEITVKDIESAISKQIYWKIPNNYFSIMEAINKGMSVSEINSRSNIANSFKDLSTKISDDIALETISKYKI